ncbi:hypothetical protein C8P64_2734 [Christiangramia gaetbulicola]|uniref:Uncharacterized protein n=1 Tax=Christiangramia gaetbulicola TaxID=703340 RepID=A0A2T6AEV8_9FLAO|nr:hypothetical protein [Christiangramia gaetbulicola]PTX42306.1 hypothetical protein C8P64_2734 [Christiangramia gaetbulicola]
MNNEELNTGDPGVQRNKWNLILGILFLGYGSFRLYQKLQMGETDAFGILLAVGFIGFGIYDLWKYYKGV